MIQNVQKKKKKIIRLKVYIEKRLVYILKNYIFATPHYLNTYYKTF